MTDKATFPGISDFIKHISETYFFIIYFTKLLKFDQLDFLFVHCCTGNRVAVSYDSTIPENELSVKKIKRIISGKTISMRNPNFPEYIHFSFPFPFVYVTDKHSNYRKMKTLYNAIDIKISSKHRFKKPLTGNVMSSPKVRGRKYKPRKQ